MFFSLSSAKMQIKNKKIQSVTIATGKFEIIMSTFPHVQLNSPIYIYLTVTVFKG